MGGKDNIWLWFENRSRNHDYIVSLIGEEGNVTLRISMKGHDSRMYGLPFASTCWTRYPKDDFGDLRRFKENTSRLIQRDFNENVVLR